MGEYSEKKLLQVLFVMLITVEFISCSNINRPPANALSCKDAKLNSLITNSITTLKVPDYPDPFYVSCIEDPVGGDTWTVIQRRQNGHIDFDRNWIDYVNGFGVVEDEYFIGLSKLHALTKSEPQELWVELKYFNGNRTFATYDSFAIGDKDTKYALIDLGAYIGTAGDGLRKHKGQKFSTKDADHDAWEDGSCAKHYNSGWWFKACLDSNLNGQYHGNGIAPAKKWGGIYWYDFVDWDRTNSLMYTHMAIRPKKN